MPAIYVLLITFMLVAVCFVWCLEAAHLEKGPDGRRRYCASQT